jgi:hypothetical protein
MESCACMSHDSGMCLVGLNYIHNSSGSFHNNIQSQYEKTDSEDEETLKRNRLDACL